MTQHSVLTQHNRAVIIEAYIFSIKIPFSSGVFVENQKKYIFGTLNQSQI